jgi:hypothetical protein
MPVKIQDQEKIACRIACADQLVLDSKVGRAPDDLEVIYISTTWCKRWLHDGKCQLPSRHSSALAAGVVSTIPIIPYCAPYSGRSDPLVVIGTSQ